MGGSDYPHLIESFEAWEHFVTHELVQVRHEMDDRNAGGWTTVDRYVGGELELHLAAKIRPRLVDAEAREFAAVFKWPMTHVGGPPFSTRGMHDVQVGLHHAAADQTRGSMLIVIPQPIQDPQFGFGGILRVPFVRLYGFNDFLGWVREVFDLPDGLVEEFLGGRDREARASERRIRRSPRDSETPREIVQCGPEAMNAIPNDEAQIARRLLADGRTPNWLAGLTVCISDVGVRATCVETAHFSIEGLDVYPRTVQTAACSLERGGFHRATLGRR